MSNERRRSMNGHVALAIAVVLLVAGQALAEMGRDTAVESAAPVHRPDTITLWRDDLEDSSRVLASSNLTLFNGAAALEASNFNGSSWVKEGLVVDNGPSSYDIPIASSCDVLVDNGTYKMWYWAQDSTATNRIAYATSADGVAWVKHGVVLTADGTGAESVSVGYPSVIKLADGYKMWYHGSDGIHARILSAESPDGINWTRLGVAVDIGGSQEGNHVTFPEVLLDSDGIYRMWYSGTDMSGNPWNWRIFQATSIDGVTWTKQGLALNIGGAYDTGQAYGPTTIKNGTGYHMWYTGVVIGAPNDYSVCYASSTDGVTWTKRGMALDHGTYTEDSDAVENPEAVMAEDGLIMYYGGSDWTPNPDRNRILLARSATAFHAEGGLESETISLQPGYAWSELSVSKSEPYPSATINVTVLDGASGSPISGFENLTAATVNISGIDSAAHPSIRLLASFAGNGSSTPTLFSWQVASSGESLYPVIFDETAGAPTTGDMFTFSVNATDDASLADVRLLLRFDCTDGLTAQTNASMDPLSGDRFELEASVPSNAIEARYSFFAIDTAGNWNTTGPFALDVADNDSPSAADATTDTPTTGGSIVLEATASDNIEAVTVRALYHFEAVSGNTAAANASMVANGSGGFSLEVDVPGDALRLVCAFAAADSAGNWNVTGSAELAVDDDDAPSIESLLAGYAATGQLFTITAAAEDNIGVAGVSASYFFVTSEGNTSAVEAEMASGAGHSYSLGINVPLNSIELHWVASAVDGAGGAASTTERTVDVLDIVPPEVAAGNDTEAEVGELVELAPTVCQDNVCLHGRIWSFSHNGTEVTLEDESASFRFWTPGNYTVTLNVTDSAGNWAADVMIVEVHALESPQPPGGTPFPWWLVILVACIVIGLAVGAASRRRKDDGRGSGVGSPKAGGADSAHNAGPREWTPPEPMPGAIAPNAEAPAAAVQPGPAAPSVEVPHSELLENLEKRFKEGKISEETYRMLRQKYGGAS